MDLRFLDQTARKERRKFMPKMDRKQRKEKKREEKAKRLHKKKIKEEEASLTLEEKQYGKLQITIFLIVAAAGALFLLLNV
tara:strand:+ start:23351 stop:23593 length:243 start_codon:yes stop_codon:yes gene_type:complete